MLSDIDSILIDRYQIADRIKELAIEIRRDLDDLTAMNEDIVLVPILTGSIIFVADLMRQLPNKLRIGVVAASSYPGTSTVSRGAKLASDLPEDLAGRHVLIVDDILDSGSTLRLLREEITRRHARSIRSCVLLPRSCNGSWGSR